jgi:DNA polymerase-3 subunit delta
MPYQKAGSRNAPARTGRGKASIPAYQILSEQLEKDRLPRVILMYGPENYLIRWMISRIAAQYVPEETRLFNYTVIDGSRYDSAQPVIEACEMLPFMCDRKVVLIDHFRRSGGLSPNQSAIDELAAYLDSVPDTTILIITMSEEEDAGKGFTDAVRKAGRIYPFTRLDQPVLAGFIRKYLRQAGAAFTNDTVAAIIELSGYYDRESVYTLDDIRGDIDKLALYSDGTITRNDVETIVLGNEETDGFAFTDALSEGNREEALRILSAMLSHGGNEFNILGLICSQFEVMMLIQETRERGQTLSFLEKELRINKYRLRRLSGPASRFTAAHLKQSLLKAYEIDRNVKTGRMDARLGLELFISAV